MVDGGLIKMNWMNGIRHLKVFRKALIEDRVDRFKKDELTDTLKTKQAAWWLALWRVNQEIFLYTLSSNNQSGRANFLP